MEIWHAFRLKKWVQPLGKKALTKLSAEVLHNSRYLCPGHFEPDMFWSNKRERLQRWAIPVFKDKVALSDDEMRTAPWFEPGQLTPI